MTEDHPPVDLARLEKAFRKLRRIERHVFWLAAKEGLRIDQIAARLGISPERAQRLLARAICKLSRIMERRKRTWWRFW